MRASVPSLSLQDAQEYRVGQIISVLSVSYKRNPPLFVTKSADLEDEFLFQILAAFRRT